MLTVDFSQLQLKPGDTLLDLGCGEGRHLTGALEQRFSLTVIGLDLSHTDLKTSQHKLITYYPEKANHCSLVQASGFQLPFSDQTFDHIICSEVLEHINNYQDVIDEIQRTLKPQGNLCISVPRAWPERICWALSSAYHQVEGGHIRIFNGDKLRDIVTNKGFTYLKRHWAHALHSPYWWLKCAFWNKPNLFLIRWYHKLLVWDLMEKPQITRFLEQTLNPLLGKSLVLYFIKPDKEERFD